MTDLQAALDALRNADTAAGGVSPLVDQRTLERLSCLAADELRWGQQHAEELLAGGVITSALEFFVTEPLRGGSPWLMPDPEDGSPASARRLVLGDSVLPSTIAEDERDEQPEDPMFREFAALDGNAREHFRRRALEAASAAHRRLLEAHPAALDGAAAEAWHRDSQR